MTKLEYFKNEIIKILDRQEQEDNAISKSIECFEYVKSLNNTMGAIQKSQKMFSTWKINGKDVPVKKIAPGKWVRVYNEQTKGAVQTIARLKSEINKCKNSQELLNIILRNKHRFENKNGELLPIINELNKFIDKKNKRLETTSKPMWEKEYYNLCEFDKKVIDTWANEDIRKEAISLSPQANLLKKQGKELIKKNLKKAGNKLINAGKLKSDEDIIKFYGNEPKPIGHIHRKLMKLFPNCKDNTIYCGKGHFVSHIVNHHPDKPLDSYKLLDSFLTKTGEIYQDEKNGSIIFVKRDKTNAELKSLLALKEIDGKIVFWKTNYETTEKIPSKFKKITLP